ncbi:MAG: PTS lactose/cellobiose transporter subunit IIA [Bacillota bacterium]|nr:PTS lactose/cellobiose transporter subunit IIA [Bacillota bacterium]
MGNVERISEIAMQVITFSGLAKSNYLQALKAYRTKNLEAYNNFLIQGDQSFTQAHHAHLSVLQEEMNSGESQITMLMAHAEDQLMAAETIKTLIIEIVEILEERMNGYGSTL